MTPKMFPGTEITNLKFYPLLIHVNPEISEAMASDEGKIQLKKLNAACAEFTEWLMANADCTMTPALFEKSDD